MLRNAIVTCAGLMTLAGVLIVTPQNAWARRSRCCCGSYGTTYYGHSANYGSPAVYPQPSMYPQPSAYPPTSGGTDSTNAGQGYAPNSGTGSSNSGAGSSNGNAPNGRANTNANSSIGGNAPPPPPAPQTPARDQ